MHFYIVATPIGNLEDITLRALSVLKSVDTVLCEDTRVTMRLLNHYGIKTPMLSYHGRSQSSKTQKIIRLIEEGKTLALVTDAGTPGISDPGSELVFEIRQKFPQAEIFAIPGASALTAALSVAGLPSSNFLFLGFLPHKKGRQKLFAEIAACERTTVFYESPHRLVKALESLGKTIGSERKMVVCRELTKIYENVIVGDVGKIIKYFSDNPDKVRGEFVILVSGRYSK